jgi:ribosomal protein S18 acetylase RimI-like enzyme
MRQVRQIGYDYNPMTVSEILAASPDSPDAVALIGELDAHLGSRGYPFTSRHGYSVEKLLREGVAFFVSRCDGSAAGCGGVQLYGTEYAELKRMYVRPAFRGRGLGRSMLIHLAEFSRKSGAMTLRLETGIHEDAAIGLYESFGFQRRAPFGEYRDDPFSLLYEKTLV